MNGVNYLIGSEKIIYEPLPPFCDEICDFCAAFSAALMRNAEAKHFPDIMSLAFWCRRANIEKMKIGRNDENRIGRGVVFHIAPSNIPVNFAFSFLFSLLAGNANIVRVSSKPFAQVDIICHVLKELINEHRQVCRRNAIVSYPASEDAVTQVFCGEADGRMIWGGDGTVNHIRAMRTKPRCVDIAFSDRYSVALIDGSAVLAAGQQEIERLASDFYNDTYLTDQNACSSPRLILWQNAGDEAKNIFWSAVFAFAEKKYILQPAVAVDKYTRLCEDSLCFDISKQLYENLLYRVKLPVLPDDCAVRLSYHSGYFYEYDLKRTEELADIITNKFQTVTYYGIDPLELRRYIINRGLAGVDRIVPVGSALDIGLIWDGFDIISTMSRIVHII